jgi:hypothetical protein
MISKLFMCKKSKENLTISFFDSFLLILGLVSISALALLSFNHFKAVYALIFGAILFLITILFFNLKVERFKIPRHLAIVGGLILLISLIYRVEPSLWITGGQDEGVYVNAGKIYADEGKAHLIDHTRKRFEVFGETKFYDDRNIVDKGFARWPLGRTLFAHSFVASEEKSEYEFMFLPLQPLWLSIFGSFFGYENEVWALVFLGVVSIIAFGLLAFELSGGSLLTGYFAALLLSISPVHAFFSKFPVSEMTTFTFFVSGLYFLAKYFRLSNVKNINYPFNKQNKILHSTTFFYLFASAILLFTYFVSRASTFIILPALVLLFLVTISMPKNYKLRKDLLIFSSGIFVVYLLAIFIQFHLSYWYSKDIYTMVLSKFGVTEHIKLKIICAILIFLLGLFFYHKFFACKSKIIHWWQNKLGFLSISILAIAFLGGFWRSYEYAYTDKYVVLNPQWFENAHKGITSLFQTSFFVFFENLGYWGLLILFFAILSFQKSKDPRRIALLCLMAPVFIYIFIFNWDILYQYYYARYIFSEAYPLAILSISLFVGFKLESKSLGKRSIVAITLLLLTTYFYMISFQFNKREDSRITDGTNKILSYIKPNDILLFDKSFSAHEALITPLVLFYGLNVSAVLDPKELNYDTSIIRKLDFKDIYFLSQEAPDSIHYNLVDQITFNHEHSEYKPHFPRKFVNEVWVLKLYKYNPN